MTGLLLLLLVARLEAVRAVNLARFHDAPAAVAHMTADAAPIVRQLGAWPGAVDA